MRKRFNTRKITFIAPFYHYSPTTIVASLIAQRHQEWELLLVHDGPCPQVFKDQLAGYAADKRINFIELPVNLGNFGHPIRRDMLIAIGKGEISPGCEFVVITNGDNYHCPAFCDALIAPFIDDQVVGTYHYPVVHNYLGWQVLPHGLNLGNIDVCQWMVRADVACQIGWKSMDHSSDWPYMEAVIKKGGGMRGKGIVGVQGVFSIHN